MCESFYAKSDFFEMFYTDSLILYFYNIKMQDE